MMDKRLFLLLMLIAGSLLPACAQHVAVKTNLLYDVTGTVNLGVEAALDRKTTLELSANLNAWSYSDNRKMRHLLLQPEVRRWLCERFNGHFVGLHAHWAHYNWGGMMPWGIGHLDHRYQGWLAGAGLTYGYQWLLSRHWNLEASIGLGYAYLKYDKYPCHKCGRRIASEHKNYVGPTKAALSLVYLF